MTINVSDLGVTLCEFAIIAQLIGMGAGFALSAQVVGRRRTLLLAGCVFLTCCLALALFGVLFGAPSPRVRVLDGLVVLVGTTILWSWMTTLWMRLRKAARRPRTNNPGQ